MTRDDCATCLALARAGVGTDEAERYPPEASALEEFRVGEGHGGSTQLRRCRTCGTLYRYRHHHEYDVSGSWDEDYLWRVPDDAAALIAPLLGTLDDAAYDLALAKALRSPLDGAKGAAAVVAWIAAGTTRPLSEALAAAAGMFAGADHLANNACYRALLAYLRRGPAEARAVLTALERAGLGGTDRTFTPLLLKEATQHAR